MKLKKSENANLERRKPTILLIGLIISTALVLESFELVNSEVKVARVEGLTLSELAPEPVLEMDIQQPKKTKTVVQSKPNTEFVKTVKDKTKIVEKPVTKPDPTPMPDPEPCPDCEEGEDDGGELVLEDNDDIHEYVDIMPEYPGGEEALYAYLGNNMKYPAISRENNSQGAAYVNFTIEKDGSITDVKILGGKADKFCKKEAMRIIAAMPNWKAGEHMGRAVRVTYTLPVVFKLK